MLPLSRKALVAHLTVGIWTGVKLDAGDATASKRTARRLAPKADMAPVIAAMGSLRTHFYAHCPPWKEQGDRLLPLAIHDPFMAQHVDLASAFEHAADEFCLGPYKKLFSQDKGGQLPDPKDVRAKFYVRLDFEILPDQASIAKNLPGGLFAELRLEIERTQSGRVMQAQCFLWERLEFALENYARRMLSGSIFRNTIVSNLRDLAMIAPALNLLEDPEVDSLLEHGLEHLLAFDPDELRQSVKVRALAGKTAGTYLAQVRRKLKIMRQSGEIIPIR